MKNIPQTLISYLLSTDVESCFAPDLITIRLTNGDVLHCTNGQMPIDYLLQRYEPGRFGAWECAGTSLSLGIMNASASIRCAADDDAVLPSGTPILEAIALGMFDAAAVEIRTTFGFVYGETDFGTAVRFIGIITELPKTGRTTAEGTCKPDTFSLNIPMPRKVLQPGCTWVFGDNGCTFPRASVTSNNAVGAGSARSIVIPASALPAAERLFTQGVIVFTSGKNIGLSSFIQESSGGRLQLSRAPLFPLVVGDTFRVTQGCDHTLATCQTVYSNIRNYGGTPYIPNSEVAI